MVKAHWPLEAQAKAIKSAMPKSVKSKNDFDRNTHSCTRLCSTKTNCNEFSSNTHIHTTIKDTDLSKCGFLLSRIQDNLSLVSVSLKFVDLTAVNFQPSDWFIGLARLRCFTRSPAMLFYANLGKVPSKMTECSWVEEWCVKGISATSWMWIYFYTVDRDRLCKNEGISIEFKYNFDTKR